jgi:hypothetical protein
MERRSSGASSWRNAIRADGPQEAIEIGIESARIKLERLASSGQRVKFASVPLEPENRFGQTIG